MTDKTTKSLLVAIVVLLALNLYATSAGGLVPQAHAAKPEPLVRCIIEQPVVVKSIAEPVVVRGAQTWDIPVSLDSKLVDCSRRGCALRAAETKVW
ncbi:hypothetical protein NR798_35025 [Archangium gephyra]|uniref:hypothetical protein n=1 Tax=Archangium gephyra TaxID=48 RepID=UPI0035D47388